MPILVLSPMIQGFLGLGDSLRFGGDSYISFVLSSVIFFYGGWPFLKGLYDELNDRQPGMMTLIGIAITAAYVYSTLVVFAVEGQVFFWELATLVDIMLIGHYIEMKSVMSASRALEELAKLMPSEAHVIQDDGSLKDVPLDELDKGMKVLVKPGEKIPADGLVLEGKSSVNESLMTGESKPVSKKPDDEVIGGSINGEGSLTVEVTRTGEESFLSQVIELVRQAQESKSRTQNLANRAALWLTVIALGAGAVTFFVWTVFTTHDFLFALERTVTVMVITCPHALGLAVPLVVAVSTSLAAQNGFLIRNRTAFEEARNLGAIIFDKTGTLTYGEFGVTD
ncbi:MAG: HAD-IC family P-type ATPase, partial [Phycisphaeraceae bacterium]|nr:HAD-IC family P-type ATPase [Phycisphaeraceae bacterium]